VVSTRIDASARVMEVSMSLHIVGLVLSLGAIMLIDWHGLAWLAGRRRFDECLRLANAAHPIIWLGLTLLLLSGAVLGPDLSTRLGWSKQVLVLVVLNNGLIVHTMGHSLRELPATSTLSELPPLVRTRIVSSLLTSQLCWWGATVIGLVVGASRRQGT
jgi:hypothetical protein